MRIHMRCAFSRNWKAHHWSLSFTACQLSLVLNSVWWIPSIRIRSFERTRLLSRYKFHIYIYTFNRIRNDTQVSYGLHRCCCSSFMSISVSIGENKCSTHLQMNIFSFYKLQSYNVLLMHLVSIFSIIRESFLIFHFL